MACCAAGVISSQAAVLHLQRCMPHSLGTNLSHLHASAGQAVPGPEPAVLLPALIGASLGRELWQEPSACAPLQRRAAGGGHSSGLDSSCLSSALRPKGSVL